MRKKRTARARRFRRRTEEQAPGEHDIAPAPERLRDRLGPIYNGGPVHELPSRLANTVASPQSDPRHEEPTTSTSPERQEQVLARLRGSTVDAQGQPGAVPTPESTQELLPALAGRGAPEHAVAFNRNGPLRLQGRTDATFDGGQFHTEGTSVRRGRGCESCDDCIQVRGTLVATYSVSTTVTLPRVSDFPDLTPCQQRRVQDAIDNVLAPHEQQHVRAFRQYNGSTRRSFNLTLCRDQFESTIQSMFETEESARRQAAQAASDALDPFHFDVDLDCEEPDEGSNPSRGATATPPEAGPPA